MVIAVEHSWTNPHQPFQLLHVVAPLSSMMPMMRTTPMMRSLSMTRLGISGRFCWRNNAWVSDTWPRTVLSYTITSNIVTGNYYRVKLKLCSIVGSSVMQDPLDELMSKWSSFNTFIDPYLGLLILGLALQGWNYSNMMYRMMYIKLEMTHHTYIHPACNIDDHWCKYPLVI